MGWLKSNMGTIIVVLVVLGVLTFAARRTPIGAQVSNVFGVR